MRRLLAPLTDRIGERMAQSPVAPIGRRVAGTELGVLLGYLAQRVLGQYDLLVPDDDGAPGDDAVYYVGRNVLALEKRFAFRPRDFRLLDRDPRGHAPGAVHRRAVDAPVLPRRSSSRRSASSTPTRAGSCGALRRAADELRSGRNPLDDGGLVALLATRRAARRRSARCRR